MKLTDKVRILHLIEAATEAISFLDDKSLEDLYADRKLALALIKEIEIIGEAASKISKKLHTEYSNIPWKEIIGMRNHLTHVYFDINYKMIWKTIKFDLPPLLQEMKKINVED
ncbi:MAG: HepT-like ribonuclease domain-containing protein [Melioribacteraceae bacterium]